jgi:hypothetical protein
VSAVLVVVIVGVVIAAIAGATLQGEKPATPVPDAEREAVRWGPAGPDPEPAREPLPEPELPLAWEPESAIDTGPERAGPLAHLRAGLLLVLAVVVLGSVAAGCIGGALYLGAHVLQRAVG